eukprot:g4624.t1
MKNAKGTAMIFHLQVDENCNFTFKWSEPIFTKKAAKEKTRTENRHGWTGTLELKNVKRSEWIFSSNDSPSSVLLVLSTNASSTPVQSLPKFNGSACKLSLSILKSMIQKAIRRCDASKAVSCAIELIRRGVKYYTTARASSSSSHELNPNGKRPRSSTFGKDPFLELVRRLLIIAAEDCIVLHRYYPILAWLMAALAKGFIPSISHFKIVVQFVSDLAEFRYCKVSPFKRVELDCGYKIDELQEEEKVLIRSLLLRSKFGGMRGDVDMCISQAHLYLKHFLSAKRKKCITPISTSFSLECKTKPKFDVNPLQLKNLVPEGVDFHCVPRMINFVIKDIGEKKIRNAMQNNREDISDCIRKKIWLHRSSISMKERVEIIHANGFNFSVSIVEEKEENAPNNVWRLISNSVEQFSKLVINQYF